MIKQYSEINKKLSEMLKSKNPKKYFSDIMILINKVERLGVKNDMERTVNELIYELFGVRLDSSIKSNSKLSDESISKFLFFLIFLAPKILSDTDKYCMLIDKSLYYILSNNGYPLELNGNIIDEVVESLITPPETLEELEKYMDVISGRTICMKLELSLQAVVYKNIKFDLSDLGNTSFDSYGILTNDVREMIYDALMVVQENNPEESIGVDSNLVNTILATIEKICNTMSEVTNILTLNNYIRSELKFSLINGLRGDLTGYVEEIVEVIEPIIIIGGTKFVRAVTVNTIDAVLRLLYDPSFNIGCSNLLSVCKLLIVTQSLFDASKKITRLML